MAEICANGLPYFSECQPASEVRDWKKREQITVGSRQVVQITKQKDYLHHKLHLQRVFRSLRKNILLSLLYNIYNLQNHTRMTLNGDYC